MDGPELLLEYAAVAGLGTVGSLLLYPDDPRIEELREARKTTLDYNKRQEIDAEIAEIKWEDDKSALKVGALYIPAAYFAGRMILG